MDRLDRIARNHDPQRRKMVARALRPRLFIRPDCTMSLLIPILVTIGVSTCGARAEDDLETANLLVEQWAAAWNNNDRDALAAIFTENATAVYNGVHDSTRIGSNEIAEAARVEQVHNVELGEVAATEDGSFTCDGTYEGAGAKFSSQLTFELDGDLISHLVNYDELVIPGASG